MANSIDLRKNKVQSLNVKKMNKSDLKGGLILLAIAIVIVLVMGFFGAILK